MIRVSAVIPTYNRRTQVVSAIDSVLAQTMPVGEIIVVDDGSKDGTCEAIHSRYGSRITVLKQENAGVSAARNRGIREARGEWIAFLDSDDVWLPTKIERQIGVLAALGGTFGLCFTDCAYDGNPDMRMSLFEETGFDQERRLGTLEDPSEYMLLKRERGGMDPFLCQSILVLRSLLEEINGFDEGLEVAEDSDLMFRLGFKTRFCFIAERLARIDRTPTRDGLCNLYATRNDRKYENLKHLYTKWWTMPEIAGTESERIAHNLLRLMCYDSAECKIHHFRMVAAFREVRRLRSIGDRYHSIVATLLSRRLAKLRRSSENSDRTVMHSAARQTEERF